MNIREYQRLASRTSNSELSKEQRRVAAAMGLAGESGEYVDLLKKVLYHGHPDDPAARRSEIGDIAWYLAEVCEVEGWGLEDILHENVVKLRKRYPEKFSTDASLQRKDVSV
jgi:NTP pyrophosphatase (non-canonical NTP hydrolase)